LRRLVNNDGFHSIELIISIGKLASFTFLMAKGDAAKNGCFYISVLQENKTINSAK
jgi:hypothetical protein